MNIKWIFSLIACLTLYMSYTFCWALMKDFSKVDYILVFLYHYIWSYLCKSYQEILINSVRKIQVKKQKSINHWHRICPVAMQQVSSLTHTLARAVISSHLSVFVFTTEPLSTVHDWYPCPLSLFLHLPNLNLSPKQMVSCLIIFLS